MMTRRPNASKWRDDSRSAVPYVARAVESLHETSGELASIEVARRMRSVQAAPFGIVHGRDTTPSVVATDGAD